MYEVDEEKEKKEIIKRYKALLNAWDTNKGSHDKSKVREAFKVSELAHRGLRRRSGEPYIYHPLEVARIVAGEIGLGETAIVSALLHDVVEDNPDYTMDFIREKFGDKVAYIVDGLTKIKDGYDTQEKSAQAENFKKMLLTLSDDVRVILIKFADRLHNMRTLDSMPKNKQKSIAAETAYLYAPLAHRLGLYSIKSELEDLALKYTEPETYNAISKQIAETETTRARYIQKFIFPIKEALAKQGKNFEIEGRVKSVYSIYQKMKLKEIDFNEVYDVFAIRIIIDCPVEEEKKECFSVYNTVTDFYNINHSRMRDWIATPKANGYSALHVTAMGPGGRWVEIQIRTRRMHEIAERGFAAHWKYKQEQNHEKSDSGLDEWLAKVREILKTPDSNALSFLDNIKMTLFSEEVFVFTPKGDLKSLAKGSSVVDFAYNIHTQLGNNCIAAKVNHHLVPLNYVLKSGDQVEIISSKKGSPKEEWLNYVITPVAKSNITAALRENRKAYGEQGENQLKAYLSELSLAPSRSNIQKLMNFLEVSSRIDLYFLVATGKVTLDTIHQCHTKVELAPLNRPRQSSRKKQLEHPVVIKSHAPNDVVELDDVHYDISKCCYPLPGDDIIAYMPSAGNLQIHRSGCLVATSLMSRFSNRMVNVRWSNKQKAEFLTGIRLIGIDRKSLILDLVDLISQKMHFNVKAFSIETEGGIFEASIKLNVHYHSDVDKLLDEIEKIKGITTCMRINNLA